MKIGQIARRFLIPSFVVTAIYLIKHRCMVSPRAEVELNPLIRIGKGTDVSSFAKLKANDGPLEIGANVSIGTSCFIAADKGGVIIGDYTMVGPNTSIIGNNYKIRPTRRPDLPAGKDLPGRRDRRERLDRRG